MVVQADLELRDDSTSELDDESHDETKIFEPEILDSVIHDATMHDSVIPDPVIHAPVVQLPQREAFGGGLVDTSLLSSYRSHAAYYIWNNNVSTLNVLVI
jgi:hypothetical protein